MQQALQRAWLGRGPLSLALWPLSLIFGTLVAVRRWAYVRRWFEPAELPVPVVVVGNLIAGGAGKTPTVLAVVHWLRDEGWAPGIISRGYGRASDAPARMEVHPDADAARVGDEPLLLRLRSGVPVFVGADRVAVATQALAAHPGIDILVSDDGLQHPRLPRSAQIIVFDERGAGNGWLLPAGPLREPFTTQPPERTVVLYNAPGPSTPWPGHLARRRISGLVDLAGWWAGEPATALALQSLTAADEPVMAAAGLAHPQRFFDMLGAAGLRFTPLALPDHHDYPAPPWPAHVAHVVLTEKDAVKLRPERWCQPGARPKIWVAPLDFQCDASFHAALRALLPFPPTTRTPDGYPTA